MPYGETASSYLNHGLITIPVTNKKPAVRGWIEAGRKNVQIYQGKFPEADIGLLTGKPNGITVLDIDVDDEDFLRQMLKKHGSTPIISRTHSGKYHLWYRYGGEGRYIRPFGEELPVDILGNKAFSIEPDSRGYEFLRGNLDRLHKLAPMKNLDLNINGSRRADSMCIPEGGRNRALFDAGRMAYKDKWYTEEGALQEFLHSWNAENCYPPLAVEEVKRVALSLWRYHCEDRLIRPGDEPRVAIPAGLISILPPDVLWLYLRLKAAHWNSHRKFFLTLATAKGVMSQARFRQARDALESAGLIECIQRGAKGRGHKPEYRLVP